MGSYNGAEICELVGTLFLSALASSIQKGSSSLNRDDGLFLMGNENGEIYSKRSVSKLKLKLASKSSTF